jgi:hypothetical protein
MDTVELITEQTRRLPESVQREILDFVEFLFQKYNLAPAQPASSTTRKAGLHAGCAVMADDFDAPLPDDFWLGTE